MPILDTATRSAGRGGTAGFTLLETMIAIVILALALTTIMQTFGSGLRGIQINDDHLKARLLAQSVLAEQTGGRTLTPNVTRGQYDKFAWRVLVEPAQPAPGVAPSVQSVWRLFHIVVSVSWPRQRSLQLETLRLGRATP